MTQKIYIAIVLFALATRLPAQQSSNRLPVLTTVQQVRDLTPEEAAKGYPVHLRGLVIGRLMSPSCLVQDETGAVPVFRPDATNGLWPGQVVDVEGVSNPGWFAPKVIASSVTVVGEAPLPSPTKFTADDLVFGRSRTEYGEVRGVVRSVEWDAQNNMIRLSLAVGVNRLLVFIYETNPTNCLGLTDATVRLLGVVNSRFNEQRQWLGPRFNVTGFTNLIIESPAPADPFDKPVQTTRIFARSTAAWPGTDFSSGHRLKIRGAVTFYSPGKLLYIYDHGVGLAVQTPEKTPLSIGDIVDVVGFPAIGTYAPYLEDALCQKVGTTADIHPTSTTTAELLKGLHEATLVQLNAKLVSIGHHETEYVLVLQSDDFTFTASLQLGDEAGAPPFELDPGSLVQVTGICQVHEAAERMASDSPILAPTSIRLLLRSPTDVAVLKRPPWWTTARLVIALTAVTLLAVAGMAGVVLLRRRVQAQTAIIMDKARKEMILQERGRISREFHDTLEQELAGVSMQLDVVDYKYKQSPESAAESLGLVRQMVRHCRLEARRSIWDLRSMALETGDLIYALRETTKPLVEGRSIDVQVNAHGKPFRLSPEAENDLLRMGQEAVSNAVKHARPTKIEVSVAFDSASVRLLISDDGCGFDPKSPELALSGRFGLAGMAERAGRLQGKLSVNSAPGKGTRLEVVVPLQQEKNEDL